MELQYPLTLSIKLIAQVKYLFLVLFFLVFEKARPQQQNIFVSPPTSCSKKPATVYLNNLFFKKINNCRYGIDSLTECSNTGSTINVSIGKNDFCSWTIKFVKVDSIQKMINDLIGFKNKGYLFFNRASDDEYKAYLEFINRGLIITFNVSNLEVNFYFNNQDLFPTNKKKYIIWLKKNNKNSTIFSFTSGGAELMEIVRNNTLGK